MNLLLDINPAETCPYLHQKTYSEMFIAVLFIAALNSKQPKYPSTLEWISKLWFSHIMKHYTAMKWDEMKMKKLLLLGLPWWRSGWESAANAGDTGSGPGLGGSHMPRSSWAREPQLLSLRVWSLCSATREAAMVRGPRTAMKSDSRLPQLEKALAQKRRPNTAKNKKNK